MDAKYDENRLAAYMFLHSNGETWTLHNRMTGEVRDLATSNVSPNAYCDESSFATSVIGSSRNIKADDQAGQRSLITAVLRRARDRMKVVVCLSQGVAVDAIVCAEKIIRVGVDEHLKKLTVEFRLLDLSCAHSAGHVLQILRRQISSCLPGCIVRSVVRLSSSIMSRLSPSEAIACIHQVGEATLCCDLYETSWGQACDSSALGILADVAGQGYLTSARLSLVFGSKAIALLDAAWAATEGQAVDINILDPNQSDGECDGLGTRLAEFVVRAESYGIHRIQPLSNWVSDAGRLWLERASWSHEHSEVFVSASGAFARSEAHAELGIFQPLALLEMPKSRRGNIEARFPRIGGREEPTCRNCSLVALCERYNVPEVQARFDAGDIEAALRVANLICNLKAMLIGLRLRVESASRASDHALDTIL